MVELHFLFSVAIIIALSFDHCNAGIPRNDGLHDISGFDLRDGRTGEARVAIAPKFPLPPQYLPVQVQRSPPNSFRQLWTEKENRGMTPIKWLKRQVRRLKRTMGKSLHLPIRGPKSAKICIVSIFFVCIPPSLLVIPQEI